MVLNHSDFGHSTRLGCFRYKKFVHIKWSSIVSEVGSFGFRTAPKSGQKCPAFGQMPITERFGNGTDLRAPKSEQLGYWRSTVLDYLVTWVYLGLENEMSSI